MSELFYERRIETGASAHIQKLSAVPPSEQCVWEGSEDEMSSLFDFPSCAGILERSMLEKPLSSCVSEAHKLTQ